VIPAATIPDGFRPPTRRLYGERLLAAYEGGRLTVECRDPLTGPAVFASEDALDAAIALLHTVGEAFADDWHVGRDSGAALGIEITVYDRALADFECVSVERADRHEPGDPPDAWVVYHWRSSPQAPNDICLARVVFPADAGADVLTAAVRELLPAPEGVTP
jgi:hypothetical protein